MHIYTCEYWTFCCSIFPNYITVSLNKCQKINCSIKCPIISQKYTVCCRTYITFEYYIYYFVILFCYTILLYYTELFVILFWILFWILYTILLYYFEYYIFFYTIQDHAQLGKSLPNVTKISKVVTVITLYIT